MSDEYKIVTDKELQDDERISAYLRGRMTTEEEKAFAGGLNSDGAVTLWLFRLLILRNHEGDWRGE